MILREGTDSPPEAFWPFVCSPTADQQMRMVIGNLPDPSEESAFIQSLFAGLDNRQVGDISIRIFDFHGRTAFALIFTTEAVEPDTRRPGLKLAAGFFVGDYRYLSSSQFPLSIGDTLWDLLNSSFRTNLPSSGALEMVEYFLTSADRLKEEAIERIFAQSSRIVSALPLPSPGFFSRTVRKIFRRMGRKLRKAPKYLILLNDPFGDAVKDAFEALIYEFVERRRNMDRPANAAGSAAGFEIVIRHLGVGVAEIGRSTVVRTRNTSYVALY